MSTTMPHENTYELTFVHPSEDASDVKRVLAKHHVSVFAEKPMHKIRLAYLIKKQPYAFLGSVRFSLEDRTVIDQLSKDLGLECGALRYFIQRITAGKNMEQRGESREKRTVFTKSQKPVAESHVLTNEALQEKIEEILK